MTLSPARMIVAMVACFSATAGAQDPLRDTIEARSRAVLAASRTPGLAVGVMKDGKVVFAGGFGVTAAGGTQPVTSRTVFHMASISKTFVATAVLQLVEQGKIQLDEPVTRYIPYLTFKDSRDARITVRHILTHTAGIPDVTDYAWDSPEYDDGALERWVRGLKDSTLIALPGTRWQYSNIGFEVLAHLVAVVSGESFEAYVQKHILTPAGMSHSTFFMTDVDSANLATGHTLPRGVATRQNYPYNRRHAGSSTMHSSVDDMLRYATFQMHRGTIDGKQILKPETYDLLWHGERDLSQIAASDMARSRATSRPLTKVEMGLGWLLFDYSGLLVVNHDGGDRGFRSTLLIAPEQNVAVVVFTNSGADIEGLGRALLLRALGITSTATDPTVTLTAEERARYVGTYLLQAGGTTREFTIFERDGSLMAQVTGQNANVLQPLGNHMFGMPVDATIRLTITLESGTATKVLLEQRGQSFVLLRK